MSERLRRYPPGLLEKAKAMRDEGYAYHAIGLRLDRRPETIRQMLEPGWREKRLAAQRARYHAQKAAGINSPSYYSRRHKDEPKAVNLKPVQDTRDLTGIICGDPLPGRSALDKRRTENERH